MVTWQNTLSLLVHKYNSNVVRSIIIARSIFSYPATRGWCCLFHDFRTSPPRRTAVLDNNNNSGQHFQQNEKLSSWSSSFRATTTACKQQMVILFLVRLYSAMSDDVFSSYFCLPNFLLAMTCPLLTVCPPPYTYYICLMT